VSVGSVCSVCRCEGGEGGGSWELKFPLYSCARPFGARVQAFTGTLLAINTCVDVTFALDMLVAFNTAETDEDGHLIIDRCMLCASSCGGGCHMRQSMCCSMRHSLRHTINAVSVCAHACCVLTSLRRPQHSHTHTHTYTHTRTHRHRPTIARMYLKSWFALDFASTFPIDLAVTALFGDAGGSAASLRSIKLVRALRLVRLVKIARILLRSGRFDKVGGSLSRAPMGSWLRATVAKSEGEVKAMVA